MSDTTRKFTEVRTDSCDGGGHDFAKGALSGEGGARSYSWGYTISESRHGGDGTSVCTSTGHGITISGELLDEAKRFLLAHVRNCDEEEGDAPTLGDAMSEYRRGRKGANEDILFLALRSLVEEGEIVPDLPTSFDPSFAAFRKRYRDAWDRWMAGHPLDPETTEEGIYCIHCIDLLAVRPADDEDRYAQIAGDYVLDVLTPGRTVKFSDLLGTLARAWVRLARDANLKRPTQVPDLRELTLDVIGQLGGEGIVTLEEPPADGDFIVRLTNRGRQFLESGEEIEFWG